MDIQVDTGAVCSIITQKIWEQIGRPRLRKPEKKLRSYTGTIDVLGECLVKVTVEGITQDAIFTVVKTGDLLLGRDLIKQFKVSVNKIIHGECLLIEEPERIAKLLVKYEELFRDSTEPAKIEVELKCKEGKESKFFKARGLPYALKDKVEKQLQERVKAGILKPIEYSDWASPIVAVRKSLNDVRICGDYKVAVNSALDTKQYPLPKIEELFHELNGGERFSKLDLKDAYHQLPLSESSKKYTVINTHKGLYEYQRLPFGIASAPAIFQQVMEKVLHGIPGVVIYLDDITVTAPSTEEHLNRLEQVLERFKKFGFRLKRSKCEFLKPKIDFLGFEVDARGLKPAPNRIDGLVNMPVPADIKQLEAFIRFVNYYGKFIKNLATWAAPLNELRKQDVKWNWTEKHTWCFNKIKQELVDSELLTHYDPNKPIILATDASDYGIGAVLYHREKDGTERVIANASRKLMPAEINYAQIEKEALGIVYGVEKFQQYLLGRKFTLLTDHQPLVRIFNPERGTPTVTLKRLARWSVILMNYEYDIEYRKTEEFANADGFSRLPDPTAKARIKMVKREKQIQEIEEENDKRSPLNLELIGEAMAKDEELKTIINWVKIGWPKIIPKEYKCWYSRKNELSCRGKLLKFKDRVVIPRTLRKKVVLMLHSTHVGRDRMLMIARDSCWYPGLCTEIKKIAQACEICNGNKKGQKERLHPWETPENF